MSLEKEPWLCRRSGLARSRLLRLRQIEVLMSQGKAAPVACREGGHLAAELRDECLNGEIF